MRDHNGHLTFAPRLPAALSRLRFRLIFQGRCLVVEVRPTEATYHLLDGDSLDTAHHGEELTVVAGAPVTQAIPTAPATEPVTQPAGRAPRRRSPVPEVPQN